MSAALVANGLLDIWFSYREQKALLIRIQREQADAAAAKINQFVKEIEGQMGWTTQLAWSAGNIEQRRLEALRLLRQVPAITELALIDPSGREQLKVSRQAMDVVASQTDRSREPAFVEAVARQVLYGPVYFRHESEPYMTIALAGARRDAGVSMAEVNLRFIWDVVSQIKVGDRGQVYVVDGQGRLIAHSGHQSGLEQLGFLAPGPGSGRACRFLRSAVLPGAVRWHTRRAGPCRARGDCAARLAGVCRAAGRGSLRADLCLDPAFRRAARRGARACRPGWPYAGAAHGRSHRGAATDAARIGRGDLGQRIFIRTGDELEALGEQFNSMAEQLERSYATLERKVQERTHQLELANLAKSRFLAAASHDLRQPLHALGLFVAQLRTRLDAPERDRVVERIDAAIAAMNELFNALLDISKLDAGVLTPDLKEFPVQHLLDRIETTFASAAREKGLHLRVVPSSSWVRSDLILLERILLNLVSNAVRYTGEVASSLAAAGAWRVPRIDVWDSGIGIPAGPAAQCLRRVLPAGRSGAGWPARPGPRPCHRRSSVPLARSPDRAETRRPGRGSRFSVWYRWPRRGASRPIPALMPQRITDTTGSADNLIVVIDDDEPVRDGMSRLLQGWGCQVVQRRLGGGGTSSPREPGSSA